MLKSNPKTISMPASEQTYLRQCKQQIEIKYSLGNEGRLRPRDLDYLAELIEEISGIKLSHSTLKRLWKKDYDKTPHPATLNALVALLDYPDWQSFKMAQTLAQTKDKSSINSPFPLKWVGLAVTSVAAVLFLMLIISSQKGGGVHIPETVSLKADKTVTTGVPNTVIFQYDLKGARGDSFFLQQSWNPMNKLAIDPNREYASRIYYYPGFHWARLMVNEYTILFEKVHITTEDWFGVAQYNRLDQIPMYLDNKQLRTAGVLTADLASLEAAKVDLDKDIRTRFSNIKEYEGIQADQFSIATRLRCVPIQEQVCPEMELMMVTDVGEIFYVPIMDKRCVNKTQVKIGEVSKHGESDNLLAYGVENVYEWHDLQIEIMDKVGKIYLDNQLIDRIPFQNEYGKLMGLTFTFTGPGAIDYYELKNEEGALLYHDDFE